LPPFFMAIAKRLSYSLLISTLVFAAFAVVAFSGLFPWIEAQFYSPKVVSEFQSRLEQASQGIDGWKKNTLEKLDKVLGDGVFDGVFSPTSSQAAIQKRYQSAKLFLMGIRGGGSLRILSGDRSQIQFSTEDTDVKVKGDFSVTFHLVSELPSFPDLKDPGLNDGKAHVLSDLEGRSLWFLRPWKDSQGLLQGFALMSVSLEDLRLSLVEAGLAMADQPITVLAPDEFLFSLLGRKTDSTVVARVKELRVQGILPPVQRIARADGQLTVALVRKNSLNLLVPTSSLELDPILKGLLLISFYTVLFLVLFLVANLRGEPLSVVTRKVKRFQLQVVKQYLDLKEKDKIQSLRDELDSHSAEIRTDILRSLGRVKRRDREWVDRYIDTSWQEVMDLLRGPSPPTEASTGADWKRLETMLQQALTQGRFVVSAPPRQTEAVVEGDDLEELDDVEVLEEADSVEEIEASEDLEELEDAEAVEDPTERAPSLRDEELEGEEVLEELEEAEEGDEMEPESLEELPLQEGSTGVFRTSGRTAGDGTVTLLSAEIDEADEEDVEELDELEEVLDELEESQSGEDFSFSLERLDEAWNSPVTGVFDVNEDVVTLKDEMFATTESGQDEFGNLVNEVLAGEEKSSFLTLEAEDLVPSHLSREWRWTGGGFDWDRFALGEDEVNLFRALSEIVTEFDAFTAAILIDQDGHWKAQSSVGFSDAGKAVLDFSPESPLSKAFLSIRALHILKGGTAHPALRDSFHSKDMKFLKSVLCIPLLFRREPGWLILGLRRDPEDLMALLAPRRIG